jgi:hypothetical protein
MRTQMSVVVATVAATAALAIGSLDGLHAQERPDLSGTWVVEQVEFQGPQANQGGGGRGGRGGGGMRGGGGRNQGGGAERGGQRDRAVVGSPYQDGDRMRLTQTDEALIVTDERRSLMSSYAFDGRETRNPGPGDTTITSTAQWEGAALVVESVLSLTSPQDDMTLRTREVRSLSEDGRTMTLRATGTMPFGTLLSTVTLVRVD